MKQVQDKMADQGYGQGDDTIMRQHKRSALQPSNTVTLSNQASKDYIFDVDRFTSFEGNTGPYILYTIVRTKSLHAKVKAQNIDC